MSRAAQLDCQHLRSCALVLTLFLFQKGQGFFPRRVSEANRGRGQPRRGLPQTEARDAQRGGPQELPCRWLSFAHFSFATERKV